MNIEEHKRQLREEGWRTDIIDEISNAFTIACDETLPIDIAAASWNIVCGFVEEKEGVEDEDTVLAITRSIGLIAAELHRARIQSLERVN